MHGSRGCLGCYNNPSAPVSADEPSKELRNQGWKTKKPSLSEDFWSNSTCEMDISAVPSQISGSSISTSTRTEPLGGGCSSSNPSEFVNHGLLLWNQTRQKWLGNKVSEKVEKDREPKLSWNATYDSLLGTNKPFPQPIPLSEMVDFLVDTWEQEGMYD